jgi:hypothetical protein
MIEIEDNLQVGHCLLQLVANSTAVVDNRHFWLRDSQRNAPALQTIE